MNVGVKCWGTKTFKSRNNVTLFVDYTEVKVSLTVVGLKSVKLLSYITFEQKKINQNLFFES